MIDNEFPDNETLRAAVALAVRAPSVGNTQPWRWRLGSRAVELYSDSRPHPTTPDSAGRDVLLSCGATLQHFRIALASLGWWADVRRLPESAEPEHIASIAMRRYVATEQDIALAAAIPRRRTDRRNYSTWPVPLGHIAAMAARTAKDGVALFRVEVAARKDLVDAFAGSSSDDGAELLVLATSSDDRMARLRAGEATSAALLTATTLGLSSCSLPEPLEANEFRALVQSEVLDEGDFPQTILRIGWASINADPLPPSPRRELQTVISSLVDGPPRSSAAALSASL